MVRCAAVLALLLGLLVAPSTEAVDTPARPNVVVIMVDDMRADDLRFMPQTRSLLGRMRLTNFVANHPLCCPSRAELLTGQLGQNNGVHHNFGPFGQYQALLEKDNTLPRWFDDAGYATSFVGKFVNGWDPTTFPMPAGWDQFSAYSDKIYFAYGFTVWRETGATETYPTGPDALHNNDFVTQETIDQVDRAVAGAQPFFHWACYVTPHAFQYADANGDYRWQDPVPASRHIGMHAGLRAPSRGQPGFREPAGANLDRVTQRRAEALASVDEGVGDIVQATKDNGTFEDTVFVFTSDNGFMLGEHGLIGKNVPWNESLRVPLLATGPGVAAGRYGKGAMTTDIAPSLAALAGVTPGRPQDGRADLFAGTGGWTSVLIQGGTDNFARPWGWRGQRDARWTYAEYANGTKLLIDRVNDPHEVRNLASRRPAVVRRMGAATPPLN